MSQRTAFSPPVTGPQGPTGPAGAPGPAGATGATGATGASGLGTISPSTPNRAFGTSFQPNATKATLCIYSVKTQVANPLLAGTSTATVQLLSDSAATPTTERCRVEASSGVGLTVSISLTTSNTACLTYICPPGHYVRLVQTGSGTFSNTIISQPEEVLG